MVHATIAAIREKRPNDYYNEYDEFNLKHPFFIVFRFAGTVWPLVLPYCILNCLLLTALTLLNSFLQIRISILPQGHALMSLLIAYLGVSKVNLAYERYMSAQIATGHAFMILRELHQLAFTLTEKFMGSDADEWRKDVKHTIIQLIHETVGTLRDGHHAAVLARNVGSYTLLSGTNKYGSQDPMVLVHALRSHLYHDSLALKWKDSEGNIEELQLLERCKMIDLLHEFTISYSNLLRLASTPLPFALVQMGRTFTFIWTLTIPFVLTGKDFIKEYPSAFSFVILLTYGFLGLEFLSRMLSNPFGDEIKNDLNIKGMGSATIIGIENDSKRWMDSNNKDKGEGGFIDDVNHHPYLSQTSTGSLRKILKARQESFRSSGHYVVLSRSNDAIDDVVPYTAMEDGGGALQISHGLM